MISRTIALTKYYVIIVARNKARLIDILLWPTLELILFGFLSQYINSQSPALTQTMLIIIGGIVSWLFFARIMSEISLQLTDDMLSGNLSNILATPVRVTELIMGLVFASLVKLALSLIILLPFSSVLYKFNILSIGPMSILYLGTLMFWGMSLGLIISSLFFLIGPRAGAVTWAVAGIIQPFCLIFYPRLILPKVAQFISYAFPASYVFEAMRYQVLNDSLDLISIGSSILLSFIYGIVAMVTFYKSLQHMRKSGLIVRM